MYIYLNVGKQMIDVKLLLFYSNTWNHLTVCKEWAQSFLNMLSTKCVNKSYRGVWPRGVMVKATDCGIVLSEFELQSRYYVHFRTNILGKGMNPLILLAIG